MTVDAKLLPRLQAIDQRLDRGSRRFHRIEQSVVALHRSIKCLTFLVVLFFVTSLAVIVGMNIVAINVILGAIQP